MTTVERWTGREAKALRTAKRMSLEAFAAHLGVSERTLSTWESRGENIIIRAVNQAALDTSLRVSSPDVHERFIRLTDAFTTVPPDHGDTAAVQETPVQRHECHPHDGKQMALVDAGVYLAGPDNKPTWVPAFYIDIFPVTNADYARFVAATGHQPPQHWPKSKCPDTLFDHPITYVTWHDATAYASWTGKQLPTAQQWEKAARGVRGDTYPWGNQPRQVQLPRKRHRHHHPRQPLPQRRQPLRRLRPVRQHLGMDQHPHHPGPLRTQSRRLHQPFARATPSAFNDAASTMLDDDTGFRCSTPESALRNSFQTGTE